MGSIDRKRGLRPRSKKREEIYKERRKLVERLLGERSWCEACPVYAGYEEKTTYTRRWSVDIHELVRRSRGGSILDEKNLLAVCRNCHRRITGRPCESERLGLELPSWATDDMYVEAAELREAWSRGEKNIPSWEPC